MLKSRAADIGQSAQLGEQLWSGRKRPYRFFLSTGYVPGGVWIDEASSLSTKAVASARLRALILA